MDPRPAPKTISFLSDALFVVWVLMRAEVFPISIENRNQQDEKAAGSEYFCYCVVSTVLYLDASFQLYNHHLYFSLAILHENRCHQMEVVVILAKNPEI